MSPFVFIIKSKSRYAIVAVHIDDMNLIGTPKELLKTAKYFKNEFEIKDLGKQNMVLAYKSSIKQMECLSINLLMLKKKS